MKMRTENHTFVLFLFGFFLLWEWLRPLQQVTDTGSLSFFIFFIGLCFLLSFFRVRLLWSYVIKISVILYALHTLYYEGAIFTTSWVKDYLKDISANFGYIFNANWLEMSGLFRSTLFFTLLWLMSYLVYYWIIHYKQIFIFFVLTIIYITVLDTFTLYKANEAIIRVMIIGFVMHGLLNFNRLKERETLPKTKAILFKWTTPLLVFIGVSITIGYLVPKSEPQWPDPVSYLKALAQGENAEDGGRIQKVGYGTNDSRLGGPFVQDDTVVFTAEVSEKHYWRVETKDFYTGKGWESSLPSDKQTFLRENNLIRWYDASLEKTKLEAVITMYKTYPHLIYPLELLSVEASANVVYSVDLSTEKISTLRGTSPIELDAYEVNYQLPQFPIETLQTIEVGAGLERNLAFIDLYTQLPDSLPDRVRQLAEEITANKTNRYDKANAIVRYFKENPYVYETQNVAVPGKDDDYVDQFLFDTLNGYCDNYSSSMVVLLRTLDIPARWVKGYTSGEYQKNITENVKLYEITNNNAHSWVEVYFPGVGWVPFEPTKSFSNPYDFVYDFSSQKNETQEIQENEQKQLPLPEEQEPRDQEKEENNQEDKWYNRISFDLSWQQVAFFIGFLLAVATFVYKTRKKWLPIVTIIYFKHHKDEKVYFRAFEVLLKRLDQFGLKRQEGQTLRQYALYVDKFFRSNDMQKLTMSYERALYRKDDAIKEWKDSIELWENLIKKVSS